MNIIIFISLIALVFTSLLYGRGTSKRITETPIEKIKEDKQFIFTSIKLLLNPLLWFFVLIASIFASFF
jgi:predicted permease